MSRFQRRRGWSAFLLSLAACDGPAVPRDSTMANASAAGDVAPSAIFAPAIARIRDSVRIPILLPATLPAALRDPAIDEARGFVRADGYAIELRFGGTPGNVGSAAYFSGSTRVSALGEDPRAWPLRLANGVRASFRPVSCGGSCTGPILSWERDGVTYTIEIGLPSDSREADQERVLLEAANATVAVGDSTAGRGAP